MYLFMLRLKLIHVPKRGLRKLEAKKKKIKTPRCALLVAMLINDEPNALTSFC